MAKYRVTVDKQRCIGCGIAVGGCPTHAVLLSQLLHKDPESEGMGVFSEPLYDRVKQFVEACPEQAIRIKKVAE